VARQVRQAARKNFIEFGAYLGLTPKQADNSLDRLGSLRPKIEAMIGESFLRTDLQEGFLQIFRQRVGRLFG